ncbi:MAG: U32 family peptidase C-terminal domain-containing protein [Nanoarchaeota archaeon]
MSKTITLDRKSYTLPDKKPELLMPAGDLQKAKFAFAFGADAVYAGVPVFALRAKENTFSIEQVKEVVEYAHGRGKKVYLTINIYPHNEKIELFIKAMDSMIEVQPDAFIISDPGILMIVRKRLSEKGLQNTIALHLSVQQNNVNWASARFWSKQGISRIILARELSLKEVTEIATKNPEMEFEYFVHGSMCIAYSGRCLLSYYLSGRDANQGACTQPCRWQYKVLKEDKPNYDSVSSRPKTEVSEQGTKHSSKRNARDGNYVIEERFRPGEYHPVEEDENGTYIMNSKDMCMIDYLEDLMNAGVCSFKVEGRNKSVYYAAITARAYREAIDTIYEGEKPDVKRLLAELQSAGNRGFIPGFLAGDLEEKAQRYDKNGLLQTHVFAGIMTDYDNTKSTVTIAARNRIDADDTIELVTPTKTISITINEMTNADGNSISTVHPGAGTFTVSLPEKESVDSEFAVARMKGQQKRNKK